MLNLKQIFSSFLGFESTETTQQFYDNSIPLPILDLYEIKALYDKIAPDNRLFEIQDSLYFRQKLDLSGDFFTFLVENQGNWICQTSTNRFNSSVIFDDRCGTREVISNSLDSFLTTYALQELTFCLEYLSDLHWKPNEIKKIFTNIEEIWVNKTYVYPDSEHSYFILDNEVIFTYVNGDTFFSTSNLEKFKWIESKLK
ncbi:hypothetical protein GCM10027035_10750 [Emticicia sediminis]